MSINQILNKFILFVNYEQRLSKNTVDAYKKDLSKYINHLEESDIKNVKNINYNDIRSFVVNLSKKNYKPSSINRNISSIKKFHQYMVDFNILDINASELVEFQKHRKNYPDSLSFNEINLIMNQVSEDCFIGIRDMSILTLLYSTGIRVSELINLKLSNIYFKEEYIQVMGKGNKERIAPLGIVAKNALHKYLDSIKLNSIKSDAGYIYISYRSKKLTRMSVYNIIKKYVKLAEINKNVSPHTIRHSFATHMIEGGADLRIVQELLGHENISTTEIYTHLDKTYLKEVHKLCHPRG